jgi:hypothetical protein
VTVQILDQVEPLGLGIYQGRGGHGRLRHNDHPRWPRWPSLASARQKEAGSVMDLWQDARGIITVFLEAQL